MGDTSGNEDKKCRICGFADIKNVNIFTHLSKNLDEKIRAVYPILLYKNDPLPQNICKKCINNVTNQHNEINRMNKQQKNWINNVRAMQPNHNFIKIVDFIQDATSETKKSIKFNFDVDISEDTLFRFVVINDEQIQSQSNFNTNSTAVDAAAYASVPACKDNSSKALSSHNIMDCKVKLNEPKCIEDLKAILVHHGCKLSIVDGQYVAFLNINATNENTDERVKIKVQPLVADNDEFTCAFTTSKDLAEIKCQYCTLTFKSLKLLSIHQLNHMRINIPKIFPKKFLRKSLRRGKVVTVNERKCIRCLNCWYTYVNKKAILNHWTHGECVFYCQICGKEFLESPVLLHEHVETVHDINSSALKRYGESITLPMQSDNPKNKQQKKSILPKQKAIDIQAAQQPKHSTDTSTLDFQNSILAAEAFKTAEYYQNDGSISCHICFSTFRNIKARNSHMRKHKPAYTFGDFMNPKAADTQDNCDAKPDNINTNLNNPPTKKVATHINIETSFVAGDKTVTNNTADIDTVINTLHLKTNDNNSNSNCVSINTNSISSANTNFNAVGHNFSDNNLLENSSVAGNLLGNYFFDINAGSGSNFVTNTPEMPSISSNAIISEPMNINSTVAPTVGCTVLNNNYAVLCCNNIVAKPAIMNSPVCNTACSSDSNRNIAYNTSGNNVVGSNMPASNPFGCSTIVANPIIMNRPICNTPCINDMNRNIGYMPANNSFDIKPVIINTNTSVCNSAGISNDNRNIGYNFSSVNNVVAASNPFDCNTMTSRPTTVNTPSCNTANSNNINRNIGYNFSAVNNVVASNMTASNPFDCNTMLSRPTNMNTAACNTASNSNCNRNLSYNFSSINNVIAASNPFDCNTIVTNPTNMNMPICNTNSNDDNGNINYNLTAANNVLTGNTTSAIVCNTNASNASNSSIIPNNTQNQRPVTKLWGIRTKYVQPRGVRFPKPTEKSNNFLAQQTTQQHIIANPSVIMPPLTAEEERVSDEMAKIKNEFSDANMDLE